MAKEKLKDAHYDAHHKYFSGLVENCKETPTEQKGFFKLLAKMIPVLEKAVKREEEQD